MPVQRQPPNIETELIACFKLIAFSFLFSGMASILGDILLNNIFRSGFEDSSHKLSNFAITGIIGGLCDDAPKVIEHCRGIKKRYYQSGVQVNDLMKNSETIGGLYGLTHSVVPAEKLFWPAVKLSSIYAANRALGYDGDQSWHNLSAYITGIIALGSLAVCYAVTRPYPKHVYDAAVDRVRAKDRMHKKANERISINSFRNPVSDPSYQDLDYIRHHTDTRPRFVSR